MSKITSELSHDDGANETITKAGNITVADIPRQLEVIIVMEDIKKLCVEKTLYIDLENADESYLSKFITSE